MVKISVCVTTYKRPHTLEQLIASFIVQPYQSAELVIVDDAPMDETKKMVLSYAKKDKRIKYFTNKKNLGYSQNLQKTFEKSEGKYLFVLGDDDLIIGENILERYVNIFESHPKVAFIYSNLLQFNNDLTLTYVYNFFSKSKEFSLGKDALQSIWLKSTFIGGMGLRKVNGFTHLYPKETLLFPQVEVVAKLLLSHGAYYLAEYAVAARVHADQLAFHMMDKKRVKGTEKHAYSELYVIADKLKLYIQKVGIKSGSSLSKKIEEIIRVFLVQADLSSILAEGTSRSKRAFFRTIFSTLQNDKRVSHTPFFWFQLLVFAIVPLPVTTFLKEIYRNYLIKTYWQEELHFFKNRKEIIFPRMKKKI